MSEINLFTVIFGMPVLACAGLVGLAKIISKINLEPKCLYEWPCGTERHKLLNSSYSRELLMFESRSDLLRCSDPQLNLLQKHHCHLEAMHRSIQDVKIVNDVSRANFSQDFATAEKNLRVIAESLKEKTPSRELFERAAATDSLLRSMTSKANRLLEEAETEAVSEVTRKALETMGYSVRASGQRLLASKGETSIRAEIGSGSKLTIDTRSFRGFSCHEEMARLERSLRERGLHLMRVAAIEGSRRKENVLLTDPFPFINVKAEKIAAQPVKPVKAKATQVKAAATQAQKSPSETNQQVYQNMVRAHHQQSLKIKER